MVLLSFIENGHEEKYGEHIEFTFQEWEKIKNRIIKHLRALYENAINVDEFVKLMLLFHDCGKLTPIYQRYLYKKKEENTIKLGYRHEIVSSIICFNSLENLFIKGNIEKERAIMEICGAIFFHHSFFASKILHISEVDNVVAHLKKFFKKEITLCEEAPIEMRTLSKRLIDIELDIEQAIPLEGIKSILRNIYGYLSQQGMNGQRAMLRTTGLLQILCVCDNRAASKRGTKEYTSIYFREILNGGLLGG
jgi:CRISPR-associated endonuclease Cas3-HD